MLPFRAVKYAQVLRAIGQDLEASRWRYFDLKCEGENYLVRVETSAECLEFGYTSADIGRLERAGRALRSNPSLTPDFSALSQVLRAIGHYIDRKDGYLRELAKRIPSPGGRVLSVHYKTATSSSTREEFSASGVYGVCVRMLKDRERGGR